MIGVPFLPLFVPGNRPDRFAKAALAGADAIIIDLEDAVAAGAKQVARAALVAGLQAPLPCPVWIRINAVDTADHAADLAALAGLGFAGVMLPKAETAADIAVLRGKLPAGCVVIALIESAAGLAASRPIAAAADRIAFGSIDYAGSIGASHRREALLAARSELVLVAALAGKPAPIDGVTTAVSDAALIEDDAAYGAMLGFGGKLLIHPKQIAPAVRGFAPGADDVAEARRLIGAVGANAAQFEGRMVDLPVLNAARRLIARADAAMARLQALERRE